MREDEDVHTLKEEFLRLELSPPPPPEYFRDALPWYNGTINRSNT